MNRTSTNLRPQLVAIGMLVLVGLLILVLWTFQHEINYRLNHSSITSIHKILNYADGQFIVDEHALNLDISGSVSNAPMLSDVRISKTERSIGRWLFIKDNGRILLERITPSYFGLYKVDYFDVSDLIVFYGEQTFACELNPLSTRYARDYDFGQILILEDRTGDGRADTPILFRTFVPEKPGMSSADLFPACPVK
jgi:hypothetical protein